MNALNNSLINYVACIYSGTSDCGPSEIGTQYNRLLYKGHSSRFKKNCFPIDLEPPKEDNLSTKDTTAEFILSPTCTVFGGSTVCRFKLYSLTSY